MSNFFFSHPSEFPTPFRMSPTHVRYHALSHVFLIFSLTLALDYVISRGAQVLVDNQKRHIFSSKFCNVSVKFYLIV